MSAATPATGDFTPLPTAEEFFDRVMGEIEPELTSTGIETLDAKYQNETPEDAAARAEHYEEAFAEYERRLAAYVAEQHAEVTHYRHAALQSMEHESQAEDSAKLADLESSISSQS